MSTDPQSRPEAPAFDPEGFRPLPIVDVRAAAARAEAETLLAQASEARAEAEDTARRIVDNARVDAERLRDEARDLRTRTLSAAASDADRIRVTAKAETEQQRERDDKLDTWAARAIIAGTVGLTASGEYALARMAGFDPQVAWLFPFVIDVYVIQAFRRHRDIIQAISLTVAANVSYHLAEKGLFGVEEAVAKGRAEPEPTWWLIALVASVASLILWRVHLMTAPPKVRRERREKRQEPVQSAASLPRQEGTPVATERPTEAPPTSPAKTATPAANSPRQETPPGAAKSIAKTPDRKPTTGGKKAPAKSRQKTTPEKAPRRSMSEWVTLTEPIFHAEFKRLKRNPTASEFADAISTAGHGRPSDSTAKNIRTEVLDRAELPSLD